MRAIGDYFENCACQILTQAGYRVIIKNYTAARLGELDIVAYCTTPYPNGQILPTLVGIEVKARKNAKFGYASQMVTPQKQRKIINTMSHFLQNNEQYQNFDIRFDVMAFCGDEYQWIKNAFLAN